LAYRANSYDSTVPTTRDLCVAGEGQEGSGDSHAGKTKNNGAHGDQREEHEQPLV